MKSKEEIRMSYKNLLLAQSEPRSTVNQLKRLLYADLQKIWGAKLRAHGNEDNYRNLLDSAGLTGSIIKSVFAAEVYPDRNPPEIIISGDELDIHDDLHAKYPSGDTRISGKVVIETTGLSYFMLDPISLAYNITRVPTTASCTEVANLLLQNGYIPVDSEFEIIPVPLTTP